MFWKNDSVIWSFNLFFTHFELEKSVGRYVIVQPQALSFFIVNITDSYIGFC